MKIFEKRQYIDGGPNDRGRVIGYELGESSQQLEEKFGINHGFTQFYEITREEYLRRKNELENELKIFTILNLPVNRPGVKRPRKRRSIKNSI